MGTFDEVNILSVFLTSTHQGNSSHISSSMTSSVTRPLADGLGHLVAPIFWRVVESSYVSNGGTPGDCGLEIAGRG
ncbi:hypothetical protein OUZ56_012345 [Daphnia magna]|uniref:Uncharacterized protein n=1 Tax=Daphnia magna TaxID=35525 RepID=A0ABQ9Z2Q7_9CRUS|nr:hypothetical protein OUZ56_012345 [Daphnia magna]